MGSDDDGMTGSGRTEIETPRNPEQPESTRPLFSRGESPAQRTLEELLNKPPVPVSHIAGDEFGDEATPDILLRARDRNSVSKESFVRNSDTGWEIGLSKTNVKKTLSHSAHLEQVRSVAGLSDMLRNAVLVKTEANRSEYDRTNIPWFHHFYAPLEIEDDLYIARLVVKDTRQGKKFYDHDLSAIERPADSAGGQVPNLGRPNQRAIVSIPELLEGVKPEHFPEHFLSREVAGKDTKGGMQTVSNRETFTCSWDKLLWACMVIWVVLMAVEAVVCFDWGLKAWPASPVKAVIYLIIAAASVLVFLVGLWAPRGYVVTPDAVVVRRPIGACRVAMADINEVAIADDDLLDWRYTLHLGLDGLFGYYGKFYNKPMGMFTGHLTRRDTCILIKKKNGKYVALSPDTPKEFVACVRAKLTISGEEHMA